MSTYGSFEIEDADIVRLDGRIDGENDGRERSGWVNVGAFAVRIELNPAGDLTLTAYPCGNEDKAMAGFTLKHDNAMAAGAIDGAASDADDEISAVIPAAADPGTQDDDGAEIVRPAHVIRGGNAYWLEPLPSGVSCLVSAPIFAAGGIDWENEFEVDEDECAEYAEIVLALQA